MKSILSKIISLIAAATVLSAGFAAVPDTIPKSDDSIPIIQIEPESGVDENDGEGNQAAPQCDDPDEIILQ